MSVRGPSPERCFGLGHGVRRRSEIEVARSCFAVVVAVGALGLTSCGGDPADGSTGGTAGTSFGTAGGGSSAEHAAGTTHGGGGGSINGEATNAGSVNGGSGGGPEGPQGGGSGNLTGAGAGGSSPSPNAGEAGLGGEGGAKETGGSGGTGGPGGSGGEGGTQPVRVCTFTESGVTVTVVGDCSPDDGVTVSLGTAPSTLEKSVTPASPVVTLGNVGNRRASVRITPAAGTPASEILAAEIGADGAIAPLAHDVDATGSVIDVRGDGNYALVRVAPAPLPSCSAEVKAGNASASSNSELDALETVSFIAGNLSLLSSVSELSKLACLRSVGGNLVIADSVLANTAGLANLVKVGGKITVTNNAALERLALPSLLLLGADLDVENNPVLTELVVSRLAQLLGTNVALQMYRNGAPTGAGLSVDLRSLQIVRGLLQLDENAGLLNVNGLSALTRTDGGVYITENPRLTEVRLPALEKAARWLQIKSNDSLTTIEIDNLTSIGDPENGDNFYINSNPALTRVKMSKLTEIADAFQLAGNGSAAAGDMIVDFSSLRAVGNGLTIQSNPKLKSLEGFGSLEEVSKIELYSNGVLVADFSHVTGLRSLDARWNDALTKIDLSGRTEFTEVRAENNAALAEIDASDLVTASNVQLWNNGANAAGGITTLDFSKLKTLTASWGLDLQVNPGLRDLDGFSSLEVIEGDVHIAQNAQLTNVDGLAKLKEIAGWLWVYDNDELTSFDLPALTSLSRDLFISGNAKLPTCVATAFRDAIPPRENYTRLVNITNNLADSCEEDPGPPEW